MINTKDYVVLLHGFWRTSKSMKKLEKILTKDGYLVINLDYPSRKENIENISNNYLKKTLIDKCTDKNKKINFVTHSMGGIVVRYFLSKNKLKNIGRVVMLAFPNKGTKLADFLTKSLIISSILGPALKELKTDKKSLTQKIPLPDYEFGVIASKYDEKVSVENTKLKNMKDFLLVSNTHTYIMNSDKVIKAIQSFLKKGKF